MIITTTPEASAHDTLTYPTHIQHTMPSTLPHTTPCDFPPPQHVLIHPGELCIDGWGLNLDSLLLGLELREGRVGTSCEAEGDCGS